MGFQKWDLLKIMAIANIVQNFFLNIKKMSSGNSNAIIFFVIVQYDPEDLQDAANAASGLNNNDIKETNAKPNTVNFHEIRMVANSPSSSLHRYVSRWYASSIDVATIVSSNFYASWCIRSDPQNVGFRISLNYIKVLHSVAFFI